MTELIQNLPQRGVVQWIGLRLEKRAPIKVVSTIEVNPESGIVGDRYHGSSKKRQVTLIQFEHLAAIGSMLGRDSVNPELLRRNLVISGINLLALKDQRFRVGTALLEYTGQCHPCSRMEEALGSGGYNGMRGHGGITARIILAGCIKLGEELRAGED